MQLLSSSLFLCVFFFVFLYFYNPFIVSLTFLFRQNNTCIFFFQVVENYQTQNDPGVLDAMQQLLELTLRSHIPLERHNLVLICPLTDIDECIQKVKNNCSHTCVNSPGSYHCNCTIGFQLSQDKKTCKCPKGFQESANRTSCLGKYQHKDSGSKCSSSSLVELISAFSLSWS